MPKLVEIGLWSGVLIATMLIAMGGCNKTESKEAQPAGTTESAKTASGGQNAVPASESATAKTQINPQLSEAARRVDAAHWIALASIQYAAAHGGAMPGPRSFKVDLAPYIKRDQKAVLDSCQWVFLGGGKDMSQEERKKTELARIKSKDGTQIAYMDGSADFVQNP